MLSCGDLCYLVVPLAGGTVLDCEELPDGDILVDGAGDLLM